MYHDLVRSVTRSIFGKKLLGLMNLFEYKNSFCMDMCSQTIMFSKKIPTCIIVRLK